MSETPRQARDRIESSGGESSAPNPILNDDVTCEHGTAMDVHCCGCHSGFLFNSHTCTCLHPTQASAARLTAIAEQIAWSIHYSINDNSRDALGAEILAALMAEVAHVETLQQQIADAQDTCRRADEARWQAEQQRDAALAALEAIEQLMDKFVAPAAMVDEFDRIVAALHPDTDRAKEEK